MAASVTVLWLVAALLGGAFSLTCFHCNTTMNDCFEQEMPCSEKQDVCITTLTEIRQDKTSQQKPIKHLVKSCGEKNQCNQIYSMSFNSTRLFASTTCCDKDKCKTAMPAVEIEEKESQLKCPYCNELLAKCNDTDKFSCYGKENKCVSFKSKDGTTVSKWMGCATENVCNMKIVPTLPMSQTMVPSFECSHAGPLLPGLLLPAAFGLALLKLLL